MRTIIDYMQFCHIHFYQKIALKKVARANAALSLSQNDKILQVKHGARSNLVVGLNNKFLRRINILQFFNNCFMFS